MLLILAVTLSLCQALQADQPSTSVLNAGNKEGKIIDGFVATRGQFPYMAALLVDGSFMAGGSLISESWVLTCGHCTYFFDEFTVYLGAHQITAEEEGRVAIHTTDKFVAPTFSFNNTDAGLLVYNDLGMLRLPTPVAYSEWIQPAKLPTRAQVGNDLLGLTVRISGWGATAFGSHNASDVLKYLDLNVISNEDCEALVQYPVVTDVVLCADSPGFETICKGDSGSPLVLLDGTQVGVGSFASNNCDDGGPQGFARVTAFLDWVADTSGIVIP